MVHLPAAGVFHYISRNNYNLYLGIYQHPPPPSFFLLRFFQDFHSFPVMEVRTDNQEYFWIGEGEGGEGGEGEGGEGEGGEGEGGEGEGGEGEGGEGEGGEGEGGEGVGAGEGEGGEGDIFCTIAFPILFFQVPCNAPHQ